MNRCSGQFSPSILPGQPLGQKGTVPGVSESWLFILLFMPFVQYRAVVPMAFVLVQAGTTISREDILLRRQCLCNGESAGLVLEETPRI